MIRVTGNIFVIENKLVSRRLRFERGSGIRTVSLINKRTGTEYVRQPAACEFLLKINGTAVSGYSKPIVSELDGERRAVQSALELTGAKVTHPSAGVERLNIELKSVEPDAVIKVCFEIREGQAGLAKWLEIMAGASELQVEMAFHEVLHAFPGERGEVDIYLRHGLLPAGRHFFSSGSEDILQLGNDKIGEGFFLINEAPGPLKAFFVYPEWPETAISIGYDPACFCKYLLPGESFRTHKVHLCLYEGEHDSQIERNKLRRYLRSQLPEYQPDDFMYCTWIPFLKDVDAPLLLELIEQAADLGFSTFLLDDGWFVDDGWAVDRRKFPGGLEEIADAVHAHDMKFGLWFNIGTAYGDSDGSPEHNMLDTSGKFKTCGFSSDTPVRCPASAYRRRLIEKLSALAGDFKVDYFKLDFSSVISPYGVTTVGCAGQYHDYHRGQADSVFQIYDSLLTIRDEVKSRFSHLSIDFSFEAFGSDRPSLAALQYSDLNHISNMHTRKNSPYTALDIRNEMYCFSTLLPNERLLASLICLDGPKALEHLLTAFMCAPLLTGDLRLLDAAAKRVISAVMARLGRITADGPLTEFVKLRGDSRIGRSDWDGFIRFNEAGRGVVCIFGNDSRLPAEFYLAGLPDGRYYKLLDIISQEVAGTFRTGDPQSVIVMGWPDGVNCRAFELQLCYQEEEKR